MKHAIIWLALLAVAGVPATAQNGGPSMDADYPGWLDAQLKTMADGSLDIDRRAAAREAVLESLRISDARQQIARCGIVAGRILPYMEAENAVTSIYACQIAVGARHVYLVPVLTKGLRSQQVTVRYWSAKGLADIQSGMYSMGGTEFFDNPIRALAEQGVSEDSGLVAREIFRALGADDPARMTDARRNGAIFTSFAAVFGERAKRLADRKLDQLSADVQAAMSAIQWTRASGTNRTLIIRTAGQVLCWASQIYVFDADNLMDHQKAALEHLMLKSAEAVSRALSQQDVEKMPWVRDEENWPRDATDPSMTELWQRRAFSLLGNVRARLREGNGPEMALLVLNWVGSPDTPNFKLKALGIAPAAGLNPRPADVPATEPDAGGDADASADGDADEDAG